MIAALFTVTALWAQGVAPEAPSRWVGPTSGLAMVHIAAGTFTMGSPDGEASREPDEVRHSVQLTRGFWMGEKEISQDLWVQVMGTTPFQADYQGVSLLGPTLPAQNLSWLDAARFCNALSLKDGLKPAYTIQGSQVGWDGSANGYRLPTEAEWEYTARAGTDKPYLGARGAGGLCSVANIADNTARKHWPSWTGAVPCTDGFVGPSPVGSLQPSTWGIYDLSGNVWEWVWDLYGPYPTDTATDPTGALTGTWRIARGGAWANNGAFNRVARRSRRPDGAPDGLTGFRVARSE